MKKQPMFHEAYSDLLTDPELLPVIQELDSMCHTPRLPESVTWREISSLYAQETAGKPATRLLQSMSLHPIWHSLTRKALLIPVIFALFLAITAFTLTFSPLLQSMLSHELGSNVPISSTIYDNINQSQKIGNTTVTLEKGYADANQIILGYTLSSPNAQLTFQYGGLQTQNGAHLSAGTAAAFKSDSKTTATMLSFDTFGLKAPSSTLSLIFTASFGTTPGYKNPHIVTFHFTLPFHPGVVVTSGQKSTSQGTTVTLDRVVITQTATNVFLEGLYFWLPTHQNLRTDSVTLQREGDTHIYHIGYGYGPNPPKETFFTFYQNFAHQPGIWTLTIKGYGYPTATSNVRIANYTWIFHFTTHA
jgi:hypothetical protein